ncbi:MAG TPA: hypothetical protein VMJ10_03735 [Kofleriaceae bacterium]|nr:hypothetical protein [Kofleriaceae bacterium]
MSRAIVLCALAACAAPEAAPPPHANVLEEPWLSHEADAQLVGPDGEPGPLFEGMAVGGSAPMPAQRERIAAFARANHVTIDLEIDDDELRAIRVEVRYGGGFGYEGADLLARRLHRPNNGAPCTCPEETLLNDWAFTIADHVHARVRQRVGTIGIRWQPKLELSELIERADALLDQRTADVRAEQHDRWIEVEPGRRYLLELPFRDGFTGTFRSCDPPALGDRTDLGIQVTAEHGRITAVAFETFDDDLSAALHARFGRPRIERDQGTATWHVRDRIVSLDDGTRATIAKR